MDLSFLLLEKANRPFHMAAFTIFQKPKGQQSSFGPRLFDAYRHSQAVKPFNYKLKWLGKDVAAWETVEPDMRLSHPAHCFTGTGFHAAVPRDDFLPQHRVCSTGDTRSGSATSSTVSRMAGSLS